MNPLPAVSEDCCAICFIDYQSVAVPLQSAGPIFYWSFLWPPEITELSSSDFGCLNHASIVRFIFFLSWKTNKVEILKVLPRILENFFPPNVLFLMLKLSSVLFSIYSPHNSTQGRWFYWKINKLVRDPMGSEMAHWADRAGCRWLSLSKDVGHLLQSWGPHSVFG